MPLADPHSPISPFRRHPPYGHWLWAVAMALTVFLASGRSQVAAPAIVNFDKLAHAAVFGLIATLIGRSFRNPRCVWYAILLTSAYGAADEIRQSFTPGRSVEVADWLADTVGACVAVTLYQLWPWYQQLLETPLFKRQPRPTPQSPSALKDKDKAP